MSGSAFERPSQRPPGLNAAVTRELRGAGVRRRQIHSESFEF